jgi:hypothetical protein
MQSVALLIVALVAGASAQSLNVDWGVGRLGYENKAPDVHKDNGHFHGSFPITWPAAVTNGTGDRVWLHVFVETTSTTSNGAVFSAYASETNQDPRVAADGFLLFTKASGAAKADGNIEVFMTTTNIYVGGVITCSTCSKSADLVFTAFLEYGQTLLAVTKAPFKMQDNSFTWDYSLPQGQYGVAAMVNWPDASAPTATELFAAVDVQGTGTAMVTLVYNKGAPYALAGATTPALPTAQSDNTKVVPLPARKGDYRTGGLRLCTAPCTAAVWYVSPYVVDAGTVGSNAPFDMAFGFGHEPSAAGMVFPSVLITAILALFAYLLM